MIEGHRRRRDVLGVRGLQPRGLLFVYLRMPELTGRSLEQIEGSLQRGNFRPKDFERKTTADVPAEVAA